jgi:glutamate-ammonia-ligase adenylyltransferase
MTRPLQTLLVARLREGAATSIVAAGDQGIDDPVGRFVTGVEALSPFLKRTIRRKKGLLEAVLAADTADGLSCLYRDLGNGDLRTALREARARLALGIALADLGEVWSVDEVTRALSFFADFCVDHALRAAWSDCVQLRGVTFDSPADEPSGVCFIAMGKLGAHELNYSSDIDLVALYDPVRLGLAEDSRLAPRQFAVKVVQIAIDILSQQTMHGLVFRTDLRLRPNPGATPVAVSLTAAERYYEEYGQNWERAAFIKARHCAGDADVSNDFLSIIRPFVWRRTLDYGAVADIHAVKQQIHAQKGNSDLTVRGGNVKLGVGGIREIEFFAQTQQLLLGGRDPALRSPRTEEAIAALAAAGHVDDHTHRELCTAYRYLRRVEHCLQMREDAQTQTLPVEPDAFARIALLMNEPDAARFEQAVKDHMVRVHDAYAELFGPPEPLTPVPGSLVFTGVEDDPRTLETLSKLGFREPAIVTARIRRWHQGGLRATRSVRARELLTALVPRMLTRLGALDDPDSAFAALDAFLAALPGGFQVFSLFMTHPDVLDDVILLCQSSPQLSRQMGRRPALVEGLIDGMDVTPPPRVAPVPSETLEDRLDIVRRAVNEHRTRCAAAMVLARCDPFAVGRHLSDMADDAILDLVETVRRDAALNDQDPDGELAVLGFGRLGMRTLTVCSDLDLVFVYRAAEAADGGEVRFTRLVRRVVNALSVPTAEGGLFTIDMQLRPSGGAGPAAVSTGAFETYYRETAWIWELMALTKARVVGGPSALAGWITGEIDDILTRPRDAGLVGREVVNMRRRLLTEKPPRSPLDAKRLAGGLVDLDFIVQGLALMHGDRLGRVPQSTASALEWLGQKGVLADEEAKGLLTAYHSMESLTQYLRSAFGNQPPPAIDDAREQRLRQLSDVWSPQPIADQLAAHADFVHRAFDRHFAAYAQD